MRLKSATIGIEAPEPISSASLPHSSVSARLAAASGFMFQSSAIAGRAGVIGELGLAVGRQARR